MRVKIKTLFDASCGPLVLPQYQTEGASGVDLRAFRAVELCTGDAVLVRTGICIELPPGYEAQVRLRSSFAFISGAIIPNAPATIDSDYRGEICVLLTLLATSGRQLGDVVVLEQGERFAQLVIAPVMHVEWDVVEELSPTTRGDGGFGSTGVK